MINIAITNYDIGDPPMFKNIGGFPHLNCSEYSVILNYLKSQNIKEFNIIGGEPSIHADFDKILQITNNFANEIPEAKIHLYTNGYGISDYAHLIGLNTDIVFQWYEDSNKSVPTMNKEILKAFQKLYELNYFTQKKAILEIMIGVIPEDYSFILSLIKQYNIKVIQIRFIPLYENYDDETKYQNLKDNFFKLCDQIDTKIIINPEDCIPWCQFTTEEKERLKQKHITYPVKEKTNIILYGKNKANSHFMDKQSVPFLHKDLTVVVQDITTLNQAITRYNMCENCKNKKCLGRWGRTV